MIDRDLRFRDFDFPVSDKQFQPPQRRVDDIRLLVADAATNSLIHDHFINLPSYFDHRDVLVWNNAGIGRSRLQGSTSHGVGIDLCFLLQHEQRGNGVWEAVILSEEHPTPRKGSFSLADGAVKGELLGWLQEFDASYWVKRNHYDGYRGLVRISPSPEELRKILDQHGLLMHPWYTDLNELPSNVLNPVGTSRPTSTLLSEPARRIDQDMRNKLIAQGIRSIWPSLFMSFSWRQAAPKMRLIDYEMNDEEFEISDSDVAALRSYLAEGYRVTSIGTSGVRVLESLDTLSSGKRGRTGVFIAPGFHLRHVHGLLTNLHNPMGTHIIMAAAFGGHDFIMHAYREAVKEGYYFGIHGDSMLVFSNIGLNRET